jgi:hypothetical protein
MLTHLGLQRGLQHPLVSWLSSPLGPTNSMPFSRLGRQLLGDTLLVNRRRRRLLGVAAPAAT